VVRHLLRAEASGWRGWRAGKSCPAVGRRRALQLLKSAYATASRSFRAQAHQYATLKVGLSSGRVRLGHLRTVACNILDRSATWTGASPTSPQEPVRNHFENNIVPRDCACYIYANLGFTAVRAKVVMKFN
jgi:hypothetical protein